MKKDKTKNKPKTKKQLINNIIGQLRGIDKMIEEEKECLTVLSQMKAAKSAFNNLIDKYLEDKMTKCLKECNRGGKEENWQRILKELLKR